MLFVTKRFTNNKYINLFLFNLLALFVFNLILLSICIVFTINNCYAKTDNILSPTELSPRRAMHANAPGNYEIIASADKQTIKPGDTLKIGVYITGYGNIEGAKLTLIAPTDFVLIDGKESLSSTFVRGFYYRLGEPIGIKILKSENQFDGKGSIMHISGTRSNDNGLFITPFIDKYYIDNTSLSPLTATISTELTIGNKAPFEFFLKTNTNSTSGIHKLNFYLTYFNGSEWKSSIQSVDIDIPTRYKRNELVIWIFGLLLSILVLPPHAINRVKRIFAWIISRIRPVLHKI